MFKIYDDVLPKETFEHFKKICVDTVSWNFLANAAYHVNVLENSKISKKINHYSFYRTVYKKYDNIKLMPDYDLCINNINFMLKQTKIKINLKKLIRIRFGLLTGSEKKIINLPHIDYFQPHITGLFYFGDSNGETVFYNKLFNPILSQEDTVNWITSWVDNPNSIETKVECRKNRLVLFDGLQYHSSTRPTDVPVRVAMNFNILK